MAINDSELRDNVDGEEDRPKHCAPCSLQQLQLRKNHECQKTEKELSLNGKNILEILRRKGLNVSDTAE